jgi:hypothetical protein
MALTKADKQELIELFAGIKTPDCSDDISKLLQASTLQGEQIKNLADSMKSVKETIYGNGKPGLTTVVNGLVDRASQNRWLSNSIIYICLGLGSGAIFYLVLSHGIIK